MQHNELTTSIRKIQNLKKQKVLYNKPFFKQLIKFHHIKKNNKTYTIYHNFTACIQFLQYCLPVDRVIIIIQLVLSIFLWGLIHFGLFGKRTTSHEFTLRHFLQSLTLIYNCITEYLKIAIYIHRKNFRQKMGGMQLLVIRVVQRIIEYLGSKTYPQ